MPSFRSLAATGFRLLLGKLLGKWLLIPGAFLVLLALLSVSILVMGGAGQEAKKQNAGCNAPGANSQAVAADGDTSFSGNQKNSQSQVEIAKKIDEGVKEIGYSGKVSRMVVIAAMGESTLENVGYGDDIHGVTNPDGSATTSVGILQQQNNWGSKDQRLDPKEAAKLFVLGPNQKGGGLADQPDWESKPESLAINKVQQNSDPMHYQAQGRIQLSDKIISEAGIDTKREGKTHNDGAAPAPGANSGGSDSGSGDTGSCQGSASAGKPGGESNGKDDYPIKDVPGPGVFVEDGAGFFKGECTSYAMWRLAKYMGAKDSDQPSSWPVSNTKGGSGAQLGNGAEWKSAWEARGWKVSNKPTANSVAWWGANGAQGIGESGHVAWTDKVAEDGKTFEISEYNNAALASPGHKFSHRDSVTMDDPQAPNAFLIPPEK